MKMTVILRFKLRQRGKNEIREYEDQLLDVIEAGSIWAGWQLMQKACIYTKKLKRSEKNGTMKKDKWYIETGLDAMVADLPEGERAQARAHRENCVLGLFLEKIVENN